MIGLVRQDQMLLIGDIQVNMMKGPRAIMATQDGHMFFQSLIGNPDEVYFDSPVQIRWEAKDQMLIDKYREHMSGLVIARNLPKGNNVIDIGGKK